MADKKTFDFVDVNPGLSGLAFAAEAEGGVRIGVTRVKPQDVPAYEGFFGIGAATEPERPGHVILVSLPFSMFVRERNGDPAVADLIREAARLARLTKTPPRIVLFRVAWSAAGRLGVQPEGYTAAVRSVFEEKNWVLSEVIPENRGDLFICAASRNAWNGKELVPPSADEYKSAALLVNPQEILVANGYPEAFALRNATVDHKVLEAAVSVRTAQLVLSAALASVR